MLTSGWCPAFSASPATAFTKNMAALKSGKVYCFWIASPTCFHPVRPASSRRTAAGFIFAILSPPRPRDPCPPNPPPTISLWRPMHSTPPAAPSEGPRPPPYLRCLTVHEGQTFFSVVVGTGRMRLPEGPDESACVGAGILARPENRCWLRGELTREALSRAWRFLAAGAGQCRPQSG